MNLVAIYNVFCDEELLGGSIKQIRGLVSRVLCVVQTVGNAGDSHKGGLREVSRLRETGMVDALLRFEPVETDAHECQRSKRQAGLEWAKREGFSHFILLDCDEYYDNRQFAAAMRTLEHSQHEGGAVSIRTFFKKSTLAFQELEQYYVPFIHELRPDTTVGLSDYPFHVDRMRRINTPPEKIYLFPSNEIIMHHYSWVRNDTSFELKVRNHGVNPKRRGMKKLIKDWKKDCEPGTYIRYYKQRLVEWEDPFGIEV